ncbi:MAG: patatin-like phospholipase family protein [Hyphomicrobiaceae bacterium]|nr:patatin-like phospholipase family protein [Hyphomicrobiaceae bacterium]
MSDSRASKLGLALGGGGALGWAHIGVLEILQENGIEADVVAGTSIGGLVGACYVSGNMQKLEDIARSITWFDILKTADVKLWTSGLLGGDRVTELLSTHLGDLTFDDIAKPFGVVAADLAKHKEILIRSGPLVEALRATISLPGIFEPVVRDDAVLIDGGVKNPVPVSACRQMGAERVIAVNVAGDYEGIARATGVVPGKAFEAGTFEVVMAAFAMVLNELTRARLAEHPADFLITPRIGHIQPHAFNQAGALIELGREAALDSLPSLKSLLVQ